MVSRINVILHVLCAGLCKEQKDISTLRWRMQNLVEIILSCIYLVHHLFTMAMVFGKGVV